VSPTSPTLSHEFIPVSCLALTLLTTFIADWRYLSVSVFQLPRRLCSQLISDLRTRSVWSIYWVVLFLWGSFVTFLHFGGYEFQWYARFGWWDLMTHFVSGIGVAGILLVGLRNVVSPQVSLSWMFVALLSVGAGFEVYEYIFRAFWHSWTPAYYIQDTAEDLFMACSGAVLIQYAYQIASMSYSESPVAVIGKSAE